MNVIVLLMNIIFLLSAISLISSVEGCGCGNCKLDNDESCVRCCTLFIRKRSATYANKYGAGYSPKFDSFLFGTAIEPGSEFATYSYTNDDTKYFRDRSFLPLIFNDLFN
uniref:Secreted protein n=1 Tax=Rhabditophanes sp. KR3021 TaxID=114890 RepID=A0AC35TR31_9BILA